MKRNWIFMLVMGFLLGSFANGLRAEDAPKPAAPAKADAAIPAAEAVDETEYSYGTVASVTGSEIAVKEYDYETGADVTVTYTADPKVELQGVTALTEIAAGDDIEIDYLVKDGKKVAKTVSVEKPEKPAAEEKKPEEKKA